MTTLGMDSRFAIGRVLSRSFGTLGRNAALLIGIAVALSVLPAVVFSLLGVPQLTQSGFSSSLALASSPLYWLQVPVGVLVFVFMQATVTYVALVDQDGRRPATQTAIATALARALPLLGLSAITFLAFLLFIAVLVGVTFLIRGSGLVATILVILSLIPAAMLLLTWSVSGVAIVAERPGIFGALGRSRMLTKGYRWPIFGLMIIVGILAAVINAVVVFVLGLTVAVFSSSLIAAVFAALASALGSLFLTVCVAGVYTELREVKEGASGASLAAIFE